MSLQHVMATSVRTRVVLVYILRHTLFCRLLLEKLKISRVNEQTPTIRRLKGKLQTPFKRDSAKWR